MCPSAHVCTLVVVTALAMGCGSSSTEAGTSSGGAVAESPPPPPAAEPEAVPEATVARQYAEAVIAAARAAVELPVDGHHAPERVAAARVMVAAARTANELEREHGMTDPDELVGPVTQAADALAAHLEHASDATAWQREHVVLVLELTQAMTVGVSVLQPRAGRFFERLAAPDAACMKARLWVFFGAAEQWRQAELGDSETPEQRAAWQAMTRNAADLDANLARLELPAAGTDPLDQLTHGELVATLRTARERCATR